MGPGLARLAGALLLLNALLLFPRWLPGGGLGPPWFALESALVVGAFALLPRRGWSVALAAAASLAAVVVGVVGFGDALARMSLARPLNLYLDLHLAGAVLNLLSGTMGEVRAWVLALAFSLGAVALVVVLTWLLLPERSRTPAWSRWGVGVVLVVLFTAGLAGERNAVRGSALSMPGVDLTRAQWRHLGRMMEEREHFGALLEGEPSSYAHLPDLLQRLRDRDVILAFIESYGMTALDDPRYAPVILPRLEEMEDRLRAAGLHLATGTLVASTQGGQSWLAHASLLSGLWVDSQLRYDLLLAANRETLVDDFRQAGHRTVALMPAITLPWPEGERLGYDRIHAFRDIDYRGPPLNWVTMPDQFTWWYLEREIRRGGDGRPLFAEVGLISSHAPWTPVLPVLDDWEAIGDGSIFHRWADAGESPVELWRDHDRVREHFALSVDYALNAMVGYAERFVDEGTLLIALGDHQPAPLITGEGSGWGVPVHVISGDPRLLEPFLAWGFVPGAIPDPEGPERGMDHFRDWFVPAFSVPFEGTSESLDDGEDGDA